MRNALIAALLSFVVLPAHAEGQANGKTPFDSIEVHGPMNLVVEAGKPHSVSIQGSPEFVGRVTTEVANGELRIVMKEESGSMKIGKDDRITVTTPELVSFRGEGAGVARLNNVRGQHLAVNYQGAGSLQLNGQVRHLRIQAQGVGEVDAKNLVAQDADVSFEGIGSVKVHAKNRLAASVQGMGNLTYYGNPRTVSNSASGIGSVVAGR